MAIPALCIAVISCLSIWHFQSFLSELELASTIQEKQSATLFFVVPFIVVSIGSIAAVAVMGIKYLQNSNRLKLLVTECLTNLNPEQIKTEASVDKQEKELRFKKDLAESKIQMNQLVHIVTHDLRSSLRTINSFTSLLNKSMDGRLTDDERIQMNFINSDTIKLNNTLEEIAQFSRIEQHLIKPKLYPLSNILAQAIDSCQDEIDASKTQISIPTELPNLFCDERKIKEVFTQIVRNAIRYSTPGSEPKLDITYTENDSHIEFKFQDYGLGIPEKSLEKIFLPFTQIKVKANQKGVGIGLAICKKYVELHDGKIWCHSTKDYTCFGLELKKQSEEKQTRDQIEDQIQSQDFKLNLATTSM